MFWDENKISGEDLTAFDFYPFSFILQPVFKTLVIEEDAAKDAEVGGLLFVVFTWLDYFRGVLPSGVEGFLVVLDDHCGQEMTITLDGPSARLLGYEDLHDAKAFDDLNISSNLASFAGVDADDSAGECYITMTVYPTHELRSSYKSKDPYIFAMVCLLIFVGTALIFGLYDYYVELRERKVERKAARTQALVASLFPENVQARIIQEANKDADTDEEKPKARRLLFGGRKSKDKMIAFLDQNDQEAMTATLLKKSKPIADLFPATTILFCDIGKHSRCTEKVSPFQV